MTWNSNKHLLSLFLWFGREVLTQYLSWGRSCMWIKIAITLRFDRGWTCFHDSHSRGQQVCTAVGGRLRPLCMGGPLPRIAWVSSQRGDRVSLRASNPGNQDRSCNALCDKTLQFHHFDRLLQVTPTNAYVTWEGTTQKRECQKLRVTKCPLGDWLL